eukprot:gnl/MRDRNA2_/MRDRNA2_171805_c0_seq1.p1 gnl/MRDRNA2_/MRDRNA2_171805_c0~~gnl/MRDRNA2_/MRDRNA2_171805_c0_seq1.p1  ORF type:complete len:443 (+),score=118.22 gnl/MRDRNA2_/MRDRNA2_171805_c0_seq1:170-1498(+)
MVEAEEKTLGAEIADYQLQIQFLNHENERFRNDNWKLVADLDDTKRLLRDDAHQLVELGNLRIELSRKEQEITIQKHRMKDAEERVRLSFFDELASMRNEVGLFEAEAESVRIAQMAWMKESHETYLNVRAELDTAVLASADHAIQRKDFEALRKDLKLARDALAKSDCEYLAARWENAEFQEQTAQAEWNLQEVKKEFGAVRGELEAFEGLEARRSKAATPSEGGPGPGPTQLKHGAALRTDFPTAEYFEDYMCHGRPPPGVSSAVLASSMRRQIMPPEVWKEPMTDTDTIHVPLDDQIVTEQCDALQAKDLEIAPYRHELGQTPVGSIFESRRSAATVQHKQEMEHLRDELQAVVRESQQLQNLLHVKEGQVSVLKQELKEESQQVQKMKQEYSHSQARGAMMMSQAMGFGLQKMLDENLAPGAPPLLKVGLSASTSTRG